MSPVYIEKRRRSMWDILILVVAGFMVIQGLLPPFDLVPVLFGVGVGVFVAYTRHTRYELYQDALVIRFMAPRTIVVRLAEVQEVRLVRLPLGGPALLVQRAGAGALAIMPADPAGFLARLQEGTGGKPKPPDTEPKADDGPSPASRRRRAPRRRL